mmetsp:Transcript_43202/g.71843  ORF Transcript_43202/g.71843 Transcript_43202/m.71843 type:complete len:337 (-) Transcript_43202:292-1302(-)
MAKKEDADARWIVKERDDGKNCNNWHWSETNLTVWSRERLGSLLKGCVIRENTSGRCKISELDKMKGDVTVQARKQKRFPLYELELTITWEGQLWDDDGNTLVEAKGKIKVPDLSEETYDDDMEMTVTCDEESEKKRPLKEMVRTEGAKKVREVCQAFVKELKEQVYKGAEQTLAATKPKSSTQERANSQYVVSGSETKKTTKLTIKYKFNPPPPVVYESLLDTNRIRGITASDASMSTEIGGKFSMFSGAVEGENVDLIPFTEGLATIKWKWRFATWQPGHFSTVVIKLKDKDGSTNLELEQFGVPDEERERTEKGWTNLLFDRLKAMLGGSILG